MFRSREDARAVFDSIARHTPDIAYRAKRNVEARRRNVLVRLLFWLLLN